MIIAPVETSDNSERSDFKYIYIFFFINFFYSFFNSFSIIVVYFWKIISSHS